jgi:hypothetical protein
MRHAIRVFIAALICGLSFSVAHAGTGVSVPICEPNSADCVISNWGHTEPEIVTSSISIKPMPVAVTNAAAALPKINAVTSPVNFLPKETAALISAIKHARFAKDGSIVSGQEQIEAAADAIAKKAGKGYTLTLYVKQPAKLKPDVADAQAKRVVTIDGILAGKGADKPRS